MTFKLVNCVHCFRLCPFGVSTKIRALSTTTTNSGQKNRATNFKYCMDLVRNHDYENYLCTLMYPSSIAPTAFTIHAFNVETAQIGDLQYTSDIKTGLMRMQFWIDAIDKIYQGSPPHTPTAQALSESIRRHKLTKSLFLRILESRFSQLRDDHYRSIHDIEDYGENTKSAVLYLLLELIGIKDENVNHVASHIGRSQGVVTLLRSCPYHTSKGRIYLPRESLMKVKVSGEDVIRGRKQKEVADVVYELASVANQHLEKARSMRGEVPKSVLPLFLNTVICDRYLKQLQKVDFNVFHPSLQKKNGFLPIQILTQKIRKKY